MELVDVESTTRKLDARPALVFGDVEDIIPADLAPPNGSPTVNIEKYTVGTGDHFTHQGGGRLRALVLARDTGPRVSPAWCKSNREHIFIDNQPDELRVGADAAIAALGRKDVYYLNADHIGLQSVDRFLAASDFYTVDLVDFTGLPAGLKLSVHSGSDKFSLYPIINRLIKKHGCGLHVKTAGTTWLEEVIGLAEAGGEGLQLAREVYAGAHARFDELTGPYATVIDLDLTRAATATGGRRLGRRHVRVHAAPRSARPPNTIRTSGNFSTSASRSRPSWADATPPR